MRNSGLLLLAVGALACTTVPSATGAGGDASSTTPSSTGQNGSTASVTGASSSGSGGATSTGISSTTVGSSSSGSTGSAAVLEWAQWPMPNGPHDVMVEGAANPLSYTDNGDGTVTDNVTGLMWQQNLDSGVFTASEAENYCAVTLNAAGGLAGHDDWRLPTRIELVSLIDFSKVNPSIDTSAFPNAPSMNFWTSSNVKNQPGYHYVIGFGTTYIGTNDPAGTFRARCVR